MREFFKSLMFVGVSFAGTVGLVAYADPALADVPTVAIHYSHADLASVDGRAAITRRLRLAASQVCDTGDAGQRLNELQCRIETDAKAAKALGESVAQANLPTEIAAR